MHVAFEGSPMKYSELVDSGATPTEIQAFLVGSENVPVTMRIPKNLRDAAKDAAKLYLNDSSSARWRLASRRARRP